MKFSLPQNNRASLAQLTEQANIELVSTGTIALGDLKKILDTCFTSGFTLNEVENALQCEVDDLENANNAGLHQLIALINAKND
ncbi:hypothetical protein K6Y31_15980 [Motilimonas cestriensis]|uniref:Uncharacterized protein n=1 Tax=Motilimonas cestriensis TaxID=2742685 RepID=A0ABS8WEZ1_9GAMM|nr:hypothetical protein [Motilimonas cestriensis]MCE2596301.1 hypothetical protein [Motilimonas cestriensis]